MSPHQWRVESIRQAVFDADTTTAQLDARLRLTLGPAADLEHAKRQLKAAREAHDEGRFNDSKAIMTELAGGES